MAAIIDVIACRFVVKEGQALLSLDLCPMEDALINGQPCDFVVEEVRCFDRAGCGPDLNANGRGKES